MCVSKEVPLHRMGARRGRGALSNECGRFESSSVLAIDDGWQTVAESGTAQRTQWRRDSASTVITRNQSPDLHFDRSLNPYRGCEHGCIYCFARPSHAFLGHSAGLDFERLLYAKTDVAQLLRKELACGSYVASPIAVGVNTDAYQPLERSLKLTRQVLQVLLDARHPVYLITKSSLIERDLDLLRPLAAQNLVTVCITLTTLDNSLARRLEPRATAPQRRLRTLKTLAEAGIPTRLSVSPIIPALNESEMEQIIEQGAKAGARGAHALLLRLPHELAKLFPEWLLEHYPDRAQRVLKAIRSMRDDALYNSDFGTRFVGTGPRAQLIQRRLELACKRAGIYCGRDEAFDLDCSLFKAPDPSGQQDLFG